MFLFSAFSSVGLNVFSNSLHPGAVDTNIWEAGIEKLRLNVPEVVFDFLLPIITAIRRNVMWEGEAGTLTQLYAATSSEIIKNKITGKYFHPIGQVVEPVHYATNETIQDQFWAFSEDILRQKGY